MTVLSGAVDGSVRIWQSKGSDMQFKKSSNVKFQAATPRDQAGHDLQEEHVPRCALIGHTQAVKGIAARRGSEGHTEILTCSSDTMINEYSIVL